MAKQAKIKWIDKDTKIVKSVPCKVLTDKDSWKPPQYHDGFKLWKNLGSSPTRKTSFASMTIGIPIVSPHEIYLLPDGRIVELRDDCRAGALVVRESIK